MSCPEELRTQALLDGELKGDAAAEAERHLESCADCQHWSRNQARLHEAVRAEATYHRASAPLHARVMEDLDHAELKPKEHRWRGFWPGVASGFGAAALAASLAYLVALPPATRVFVAALTDAHTQALMNEQVVAVASSDHHTVKPWFAGRIALSPPVADFAAQGFALEGGRIQNVKGEPAAVLAYRHGLHEIDLFVWADRGMRSSGTFLRHGYHVVLWQEGDLDFAAVTDMQPSELEKFVRLVQSEPE